ncbi:DinB family protein [Alkalihalobacillus sp. 1P02AB]|uniref:DinB family protein n=1 Tax=Alkalihalobacillus sp. 1P02AB TaxID=3132260 RepID=UPI0039A77E7D
MNKIITQFELMLDEMDPLNSVEENKLTEPVEAGKWSISEIIAHLYGWDKYNLEIMVPKMTAQNNLPAFPEHDPFNEKTLQSVEGKSAFEIIHMFVQTRKQLVAALSEVDKEIRFTIGTGKRAFSAESFTKIFVKHDAHHLTQIKGKL